MITQVSTFHGVVKLMEANDYLLLERSTSIHKMQWICKRHEEPLLVEPTGATEQSKTETNV